jgi:predicted nucleic acid-binding Zn ribbon protein
MGLAMANDRKCKNCGCSIDPRRTLNALYCSSVCREAFNNKKPRKKARKAA